MAPLDATEFSAGEGLQGAAQHGSEAVVRNVAFTGRLEYVGIRQIADRFRAEYIRLTGASNPGTRRR
jgi:hypothetical protein